MLQEKDETDSSIELTGTRLNELNDDCLLQIFGPHRMSLMDLCALAETCKRFRDITRRVFPKKLTFRVRDSADCIVIKGGPYPFEFYRSEEGVIRIFEHFGSSLTALSIIFGYENNLLVDLVAQHCDSLKSLSISYRENPILHVIKLQPIFKQLQVLHLDWVSMTDDPMAFSGLDSLEDLRVWHVDNFSSILQNTFPKLERFGFASRCFFSENSLDDQSLQPLFDFIPRHKNVKMLELYSTIRRETCTAAILQAVGDNWKELEELMIHYGYKTTDVCFPLLSQLPADPTSLPQLRRIIIRLNDGDWVDAVGIIKRRTNLDELNIFSFSENQFILSESTFEEIVDVTKGRANQLTLKCKIDFDAKKWESNQSVRLAAVTF